MKTLYDYFLTSTGVTTDSRKIAPGNLFFALKGASFDGNRFAIEALKLGAGWAVVDDPQLTVCHPEWRDRLWVVEDVLTALQDLAREHRRRLALPILAIVGSNGKTTTKELTACVLAEKYAVHATQGNLNNHIGVPLTLLSMRQETRFGVVEMGASACGEIAQLASIAEPNYGLITNIGRSHLEGFGGPEGIRRGKGELFDYLAAHGGRAFVPREDDTLCAMAAERPNLAVEYYSTTIADGVENQLAGDFNRLNIAAAMAVGRYFAVEEGSIRNAIASYLPQNHRSQRMKTPYNQLIVDCYNANPSSMAAAIDHFSREQAAEGRRVMILGDMLELGSWSIEEHRTVLRKALSLCDGEVWLVGPQFAEALQAEPTSSRVRTYGSTEELIEALKQKPLIGAQVLIKGSHSIGLEQLVEHL